MDKWLAGTNDLKALLDSIKIKLPTYKDISLRLWDFEFRLYEEALDEVFCIIEKSNKRLVEISNSYPPDIEDNPDLCSQLDSIYDLVEQTIEVHIGTAFTLCQRYITQTKQRYKNFRTAHKTHGGPLDELPGDLFKFGSVSIESSGPNIQTMYHIANFVKHKDEWNFDWIENSSQDTASNEITKTSMRSIVHKIRARNSGQKVLIPLAPPPLQEIIQLFGVDSLTVEDLRKLTKQVKDWQTHVKNIIDRIIVPPRFMKHG